MKLNSNKALLELPDQDTLIECFKEEIEPSIDEFKAWYSMSAKTFISTDPIFTNSYTSKSTIITEIFPTTDGKLAYYKGEVSDEGEHHGAGLRIFPFEQIVEGYYINGRICGEHKYLAYQRDNSNKIQFRMFAKCLYLEKKGYYGYFQFYTQNGNVIKEGYQKDNDLLGEQKIYLQNIIQYGKTTDEGEDKLY